MKMRLVIWLVKLLYAVGRWIGKGTSLPGSVALKLCPDILGRLKLPALVVAVTGSNGKTTTVEMIARTLEENGLRVAWNEGGSNQIEGVTTLLLRRADKNGVVQADAVILESDERYARYTFRHFTPTYFVITNLFRDQMTRNAHPEWVANLIQKAISPETTLILNGDDPLVAAFGKDRPGTLYFGMAENSLSTKQPKGRYQDHAFCPVCGGALSYDDYQFAGFGHYRCATCGLSTPAADYLVTDLDLERQEMVVNGQDKVHIAFAGRYFVYNLCAAYAVCMQAGLDGKTIAKSLSEQVQRNGRIVRFSAAGRPGILLTSKHENSVSYNQSLEYVSTRKKPVTVCILVDEISRKYFTGEISWLWDIDFEQLNQPVVRRILLCGRYAYDLATRFAATGIEKSRLTVLPDLNDMGAALAEKDGTDLYVITCFSDKDKIFARVQVQSPTAK